MKIFKNICALWMLLNFNTSIIMPFIMYIIICFIISLKFNIYIYFDLSFP
jgi:hypothetical protein